MAAIVRPRARRLVHSRRDPDQDRRGRRLSGHDAGQVRADRGAVPRRGQARLRSRRAALHDRGPRHRRARRIAGECLGSCRGQRRRGDPAQGRGQFHRHGAARNVRQCRRRASRPRDPRRVRRERRQSWQLVAEAFGDGKRQAPHPGLLPASGRVWLRPEVPPPQAGEGGGVAVTAAPTVPKSAPMPRPAT